MIFLEWLAGYVLNWLLGLLQKEVEQAADIHLRDMARGETNDANTKAYEEAVTRKDRIADALRLLNRERP